MQTVQASVILDDVYRLIGWDASQLDDRDKEDARSALSQALQEIWDAWWWQALMECVQTQLAVTPLDFGPYEVNRAFYDPGTDWYYLPLHTTGTKPVVNGVVMISAGWMKWAPCAQPAGAWTADSYEVGDQVSYNGATWQWHDPNEAGAASQPTDVPGTAEGWLVVWAWQPVVPYLNLTNSPTGPRGKVRSVSVEDPRTTAGACEFPIVPGPDNTEVLNLTVGRPWVYARRVTPVLTGNDWDAGTAYEATAPQDLVFDS